MSVLRAESPLSVVERIEEHSVKVTDVEVHTVGDLCLVVPMTVEARVWFDLYVEDPRWGHFARIVRPCNVLGLTHKLEEDGFRVRAA